MLLRSSVRSSRWLAALVLGVAPALLSGSLGGSALAPLVEGQAARAQELGPTSGERLLDEAVDHTHRNWWDRANRDKIDWKGLKDKYRPAIRAAATPRDAHHVVNDLFSELKTSHLVLMEGPAYERELQSEFQAKPTPRACFELVALPSGHFVSGILEGSPAAKAGLQPFRRGKGTEIVPGDVITAVNDEPVTGMDDMLSLLEKRQPGDTVTLTVWRAGQTRKQAVVLGTAE